jgi:hypothetical protein
MWRKNLIFATVLLLASSAAWAQITRATIAGAVTDETGALIPGVEITVTNTDTGISRSTVSNDEGRYFAPDLSLGNYQIEAALPGFQTSVRSGIQLTLGRAAIVDFTLSVGEITERVTVTGEAPLVETTQSVLADLVEQRTITELPLNGRSFTELALLQAGAMVRNGHRNSNFSPISGGGTRTSIGGARPKQNAYVLDGQDSKDAFGNTPGSAARTVLGVETVREFSVLVNAYSAEYQGAGGVVNAVTKSGTNSLHGSIFWFHRNDNLDAVDYNTKIVTGAEQPEFRRHQFGFTVGGPIVEDQTFVFGSYEGLREILGRRRVRNVFSDDARAGLFGAIDPAMVPYLALYDRANGFDFGDGEAEYNFSTSEPTRENYFLVKFDHTISESDSIDFRYSLDDAIAELYYSGTDLVRFERHPDTRRQLFNSTWRKIISPNLFNAASVSFNRSFGGLPNVQSIGESLTAPLGFIDDRKFGQITGAGVSTLGTDASGGGDRLSILNLFEYADTVTYTFGRHSLKFGGKVSRTNLNGLSGSRLHGRIVFRGLERFLTNDPFRAEFLNPLGDGTAMRGYRQTMVSTFVQDNFKLRPGLTLNGGLRWEVLNTPTEVGNRIANIRDALRDVTPYIPDQAAGEPWFENHSWTNIGPRIGIAWDPFGAGQTSVRSGYGIFYQPHTSANWWIMGYQNRPFFERVVTLPRDHADPTGFFPNAVNLFLAELSGGNVSATMSPMQFDARTPYLMQFHLTIQHQLSSDSVFSISYAANQGRKLGRLKNANVHTFATCPCVDDPNTAGFDESTLDSGMKYFPLDPSAAYPDGGAFLNPNFIDMETRQWDTNSSYNSLQLRFSKRFSGGYQVQANYTFARNLDMASGIAGGDVGGSGAATMDPFDQVRSKGLSGFHVKNNFTTNFTAEIPTGGLSGPAHHLLGDWSVGGIITATSGSARQITASGSLDQAQLGTSRGSEQVPNLVPGANHNPVQDNWESSRFYWTSDSYELQEEGTFGNLGRNVGVGPAYFNVDFSLKRDFSLAEETRLQFRAEFFNMLNRVNFGNPSGGILSGSGRISGSFGRVSGGASARQVQFGLKIIF